LLFKAEEDDVDLFGDDTAKLPFLYSVSIEMSAALTTWLFFKNSQGVGARSVARPS
jgi:hypothetical protein